MTKRDCGLTGLAILIVLGATLTVQLAAEDKKAKPPKMITYQGTVKMMDKAKSTIGVNVSNVQRDVMYSADTKFMYGHSKDNKPGSVDAVKEGFYISCAGTTEDGKLHVMAKVRVDRENKNHG